MLKPNKTALNFIITGLISLGAYWYVSKEIEIFSMQIDAISVKQNHYYRGNNISDVLSISTPIQESRIENPVQIKGEFLSKSIIDDELMAKVVGKSGDVLGQGPLYLTEDGGFEGIIPFGIPTIKDGYIVVESTSSKGISNTVSVSVVFDISVGDASCEGESCGECTIGSMGSNGVCVHGGDTKNL